MKSWRFLANIEHNVLLLILDPLLPNIECNSNTASGKQKKGKKLKNKQH